MALISEWTEQCGQKVLDNAGIVRDAWFRQLTLTSGLLVIRPSKRYSGTVSQAPRRARASELQKGFVARLDDAL